MVDGQRPPGDPEQLRDVARAIGNLVEPTGRHMIAMGRATSTAIGHLPTSRIHDFALLSSGTTRRLRRASGSIGDIAGAVRRYADALEDAQLAFDAEEDHHKKIGGPVRMPIATDRHSLPADGPRMTADPIHAEIGGNDGPRMVANPPKGVGPMREHLWDDRKMIADPPHGPAGDLRATIRPVGADGQPLDLETALFNLRQAKHACVTTLNRLSDDWVPGADGMSPVQAWSAALHSAQSGQSAPRADMPIYQRTPPETAPEGHRSPHYVICPEPARRAELDAGSSKGSTLARMPGLEPHPPRKLEVMAGGGHSTVAIGGPLGSDGVRSVIEGTIAT
ncbi:hypothetical protein [Luteipulveratus mongoliensis]|uniref:Uncharacterized protein n=1 Tax=Luteipulveratus mongoliensis TaxID=571913 RepID=A0A0K1JNA2_9MICO|nr:hypothetical protein [Luteipulveratus mongoliensis]AKU18060.1 hypothetical protein VV02_23000 [Luteipulveratus mongoliensis]